MSSTWSPLLYGPPDVVLRSISMVSAALTLPSRLSRMAGAVVDDAEIVRRFAVESKRRDGEPASDDAPVKNGSCCCEPTSEGTVTNDDVPVEPSIDRVHVPATSCCGSVSAYAVTAAGACNEIV